MIPQPVFVMLKEPLPPDPGNGPTEFGVTVRMGVPEPGCVTVMDFGLPVAPAAVTVMVPVRLVQLVLAEKFTAMVALPEPLDGLTVSQDISSDTLQVSVPQPVLLMVNEVDLAVTGRVKEAGETVSTGVVLAACTTVTVAGLPVAPAAVIVMFAVLEKQVLFAE